MKPTHAAGNSRRPALGVPTTTPVAFVSAGTVYLEQMNVVSEEGAGILCEALPVEGEVLQLCFRLSTHKGSLRCRGRVEGLLPTTPAGLALAAREGEKALHAATGTMGDSVTMMFRLADISPAAPTTPTPRNGGTLERAHGFCVRWVEPPADVAAALARHIGISRRLGEQLAAAGGRIVSISDDDRKSIATLFTDEGLSKRAMDW